MKIKMRPFVLIAEDDQDDQLLISQALKENKMSHTLRFVTDGEELMNFLRNQGEYRDRKKFPRPDLILLDLNMPRKDGREVLAEIKSNPDYCDIPVIILTTSESNEDISTSYKLGANSFITKPKSFESLSLALGMVAKYWLEVVRLPTRLLGP